MGEALRRWRALLAGWQIPDDVARQAAESPWVLPREVFVGRARRQVASPVGASYELAWAALDPPGTVLDVGSGAGAASLPLAARSSGLTAVDADAPMLAGLAAEAGRLGVAVRTVAGRWPDVAGDVAPADVVVCHHVLYNVPDLAPFVAALAGHARRLVVVEMTVRHPLVELNPLWERFHGIARPTGPTVDDALAALAECGVRPGCRRWTRPATAEYAEFATTVDVTRRRLCLPAERAGEVAEALRELGVRPDAPPDLGSSGRDLATLWWTPPE